MGSKVGSGERLFLWFTNMVRDQTEGKLFTSMVAVFAGNLYGEFKGGRFREMKAREEVERLTRDYETRLQNYEAETREMEILEAGA